MLDWQVAVGDSVTVNQVIVEIETAKAAVELPVSVRRPGARAARRTRRDGRGGDARSSRWTPIRMRDPRPPGRRRTPRRRRPRHSRLHRRSRPHVPRVPTIPATTARRPAPRSARSPPTGGSRRSSDTSPPPAPRPAAHAARRRRGRVPATAAAPPRSAVAPTSRPPSPPAGRTRRGSPASAPLATPPVRKLAKELGIDLATVTASRADGVISRGDVEARRRAEPTSAPTCRPRTTRPPGSSESRSRACAKLTAAAMVASAFTAPHVTEFLTVDVTPMMELRDRLKSPTGVRGRRS